MSFMADLIAAGYSCIQGKQRQGSRGQIWSARSSVSHRLQFIILDWIFSGLHATEYAVKGDHRNVPAGTFFRYRKRERSYAY